MSLINQVLQNVERRQVTAQVAEAGLTKQIKPVLLGQGGNQLHWFKWSLVILSVALLAWFYHNATLTPQVTIEGETTDLIENTVETDAKTNHTTPSEAKQPLQFSILEKSLNSRWQLEYPSIALQENKKNKTTNSKANVDGEALPPQAEVTEQAANTAESRVTVSKPTLAVSEAIASKPAAEDASKSTQSGSDIKGVVTKTMKPEQEANQWVQRALDYQQKGRLQEAIEAATSALTLAPQSELARVTLTGLYISAKQASNASKTLQDGLALQPQSQTYRKMLARLQMADGHLDTAIDTLRQGVNANSEPDYVALLALSLQKAGRHAEANTYFEQALKQKGGQVNWIVAYGISLQATGRSPEAQQVFTQAQGFPMSESLANFVAERLKQLK